MVAVIFFFCLFTCMLGYQVNYLAIAAYAIVSSARIHLLQGVRLFFLLDKRQKKNIRVSNFPEVSYFRNAQKVR